MAKWDPQTPGTWVPPRRRKKRPGCLEFPGLVTTLWVLSLPETVYIVFTERLLLRKMFAMSKKVLGWQTGAAKMREQDFPKKRSWFFEFDRTSDTPMGTLALSNRAYCLYKLFFNQGSV